MEKQQKVANSGVCVCSLSNPACKAHELYYIVIYVLSGSNAFSDVIS